MRKSKAPRIPLDFQAVYIAANIGREVLAPPKPVEFSQYRSWIYQSTPVSQKKKTKGANLFGDSKLKISILSEQKRQSLPDARERLRRSSQKELLRTPQNILDNLLQNRGYSTQVYKTLQTGYRTSPTPLQRASYGPKVVELVKNGDPDGLRIILAAGLSPNPCNKHGESLLHMACRRGDLDVLDVLLEAGANIQISDDYGRTPLHDACWASEPAFDVVRVLLKTDNRLFHMQDRRGALPLHYVHRDHWKQWEQFLEQNMDEFFPVNEATGEEAPELAKCPPDCLPSLEPDVSLSLSLAKMVAIGTLTPSEARVMAGFEDETEFDTDDESSTEESDEFDDADSLVSEIDYDDQMEEIYNLAEEIANARLG